VCVRHRSEKKKSRGKKRGTHKKKKERMSRRHSQMSFLFIQSLGRAYYSSILSTYISVESYPEKCTHMIYDITIIIYYIIIYRIRLLCVQMIYIFIMLTYTPSSVLAASILSHDDIFVPTHINVCNVIIL